jgi:hypothetical protein
MTSDIEEYSPVVKLFAEIRGGLSITIMGDLFSASKEFIKVS